jgi:hypothetical protein
LPQPPSDPEVQGGSRHGNKNFGLLTQVCTADHDDSFLERGAIYERLDGSSDLYCDDLGVGSRHVGRIVRDGAGFRLVKPAYLTTETWLTRAAAHHAVRNKLNGRA